MGFFIVRVFDSDRFYLIITVIFLLIGSFPCPWYVKLPLLVDGTYKILLTLFNIRTIYLFLQMMDLTTNSLRIMFRNFTTVIYLLECLSTIKNQVQSRRKVDDIAKGLQEAAKRLGIGDHQIDRATRAMVLILILLRGLELYELAVVGNSHFPHILIYTIQTAQICEWGVLVSTASHGFTHLESILYLCSERKVNQYEQTQNISLILEIFRKYKKTYTEINFHYQTMLFYKTITSYNIFVRSIYEIWRMNIVGQLYVGEGEHNIAQMYCTFFFQFVICVITDAAYQKASTDFKTTV